MILIFAVLVLSSCDKMESRAKRFAKEKTSDLLDHVMPVFDSYHPDTKYNKRRFEEFIQVQITPDVTAIYCYGDFIGIDSKYQFSFQCNAETAAKIIAKHSLELHSEEISNTEGLQEDFPWWNKELVAQLPTYQYKGDHQYYKQFWYDQKTGTAYFLDFDL